MMGTLLVPTTTPLYYYVGGLLFSNPISTWPRPTTTPTTPLPTCTTSTVAPPFHLKTSGTCMYADGRVQLFDLTTLRLLGSDGKCLKEGEIAACEEFNFSPDGEMCPPSRCTYYEAQNLCISKDKDIPCDKLYGQDCAPEGRCQWYPEP